MKLWEFEYLKKYFTCEDINEDCTGIIVANHQFDLPNGYDKDSKCLYCYKFLHEIQIDHPPEDFITPERSYEFYSWCDKSPFKKISKCPIYPN